MSGNEIDKNEKKSRSQQPTSSKNCNKAQQACRRVN